MAKAGLGATLILVLIVAICATIEGVQIEEDQYNFWRPRYHVLPASLSWMNDPNGPLYYEGYYHLFYQYNPGPVSGNKEWAHDVSKDLAFWTHLPIALRPDQPYDKDGVWSGSATLVNGVPVLSYTGVSDNVETQNLALPLDHSDPLLEQWVKYENNPILSTPPEGINTMNWRDDTTAWESKGEYRMLLGSSLNSSYGAVLLYTSSNFQNWTYTHPFWTAPTWGFMWECPDFYTLDNQTWVLKLSSDTLRNDWWNLGKYDENNQQFVPLGYSGLMDFGIYYASKSFNDPANQRQIVWGWIPEDWSDAQTMGWQGVQSLPRQIGIDPELNRWISFPLPELRKLRIDSTHRRYKNLNAIPSASPLLLDGVLGVQYEIKARFEKFDPTVPSKFGFHVLTTEGTNHSINAPNNFTAIYWTSSSSASAPFSRYPFSSSSSSSSSVKGVKATGSICIDRSNADTVGNTALQCGDIPIKDDEDTLEFRIFVDHSMIEVFVQGGRTRGTSRVYTSETATGLSIFTEKTNVVANIDIWELEDCYL